MNHSVHVRRKYLAWSVEQFAHPLFLAGALGLWWVMGRGAAAALLAFVLALLVMEGLERLVPAVPHWRRQSDEKPRLVGIFALFILVQAVVTSGYEAALCPALLEFRETTGSSIWPGDWPVLLQVLILYFASDFIYYWIHRAIHRWSLAWRLSGHGLHHAFHNLHAINVGSTHPFEVFFLALPMVLLAAVFGASSQAVAGATVLVVVNATLAHANVRMETPGLNWFFTSSNQHRRHHSVVFEESNTNYACNAIIWDRLFRTYGRGSVQETGIGPRQPKLSELFLLPFREPRDVDTVATRARERQNA